MREIKFRVWLSDRKEMIYPTDNLHLVGINGSNILRLENWFKDYINKDYCQNGNYSIQQYTSFKDKNGKEIYEGDIVEYQFYRSDNERETDRGEVFFMEGIFYFDRGRSFAANDANFIVDSLKITGNIFE